MTVLTTNLSGCVNPAVQKDKAADALREKYREEFQILSCSQTGPFADYYSVTAYAEEYPDLVFRASVDRESGTVSDTYVTKRVCGRISDKISENIAELSAEYFVFTEAMLGGSALDNPNVTLEEYMQDSPGNQFTVHLCIEREDARAQNIVSALSNMMKDIPDVSGMICIYLADESMLSDIREYVWAHDATYGDFEDMTDEAYIGAVEFVNGNFDLTAENLKEMAGNRL